jgi:hypothetical protein
VCGGDAKQLRLEKLAKAVDPKKTFLGRVVGWRYFPMDYSYPNYRMTEELLPQRYSRCFSANSREWCGMMAA